MNVNVNKSVQALDLPVKITNIVCPEKVKVDKTFEAKVDFSYLSKDYCLYGDYIYLHYTVKTLDAVFLDSGFIREPVNKQNRDQVRYTFSVDTSIMSFGEIEENVKLSFKIKYSVGGYIFGSLLNLGTYSSEYYELTITKALSLPIWAICLIGVGGLALIAVIVVFRKRIKIR